MIVAIVIAVLGCAFGLWRLSRGVDALCGVVERQEARMVLMRDAIGKMDAPICICRPPVSMDWERADLKRSMIGAEHGKGCPYGVWRDAASWC